jgi:hypothetical protein
MASAVKIGAATPPGPQPKASTSTGGWIYRVLDGTYRFLASVKLAVISLGTLASVLAYATFFESTYGAAASQEWIYQTKWFSLVLAFLGVNILCAALIRYPWKKRQTGFVVTHAGLLIVLGGSWYGLNHAIEGEVVAMEGQVKNELLKLDQPIIRIEEIDPHNPEQSDRAWELPFRPGTFGWGPGNPRPQSFLQKLNPLNLFDGQDRRQPREVLTKPGDPFQFVVKSHIPASKSVILHEPSPDGSPMVKIEPRIKAPGMPMARPLFAVEQDRWFVADKKTWRVTRSEAPSTEEPLAIRLTFTYTDRPEHVEDFLKPPAVEGKQGSVRLHYRDSSGKPRSYDMALTEANVRPILLPASDLTVSFQGVDELSAAQVRMQESYEEPRLPIAMFDVRKGEGAGEKYFAMAMMPMFPSHMPHQGHEGETPHESLVEINYYRPPIVDEKVNGLRGAVEVLGTKEGKLYYRVFGRSKDGKGTGELRPDRGPIELGQDVIAFGGNPGMPMSISFTVSEYLTSGIERQIWEPATLARSQLGNGIAASLVSMTVNENGEDVTREFFIRRSDSYEPRWKPITFPSRAFRIAYDVNREPLDFEVKLEDFEVTFDPGTDQASSYVSRVLVTDKAHNVEDKPVTISMNEPMKHVGYTFYQSSYIPEMNPRTGRKTGRFQSVFHVRYDPSWQVVYLGCILVSVGAFLQFYMRAGIFTDGGKREREQAAKKAERTNGAKDRRNKPSADKPPHRPRRDEAEDIL